MVRSFSLHGVYHECMKKTLSSIVTAMLLLTPVTSSAYFVDHFQYQMQPANMTPGYVQDPSLDLLPVGRTGSVA